MSTYTGRTYQLFIRELRAIVAAANELSELERHHESPVFLAWLHGLNDSLRRIREYRIDLHHHIGSRLFRAMAVNASVAENRKAFEHDLTNTIIELNQIIKNYKKRGAAHPAQDVLPQEKLAAAASEPKFTLPYLWRNMTATTWLTVITLVGGAFSFGAASKVVVKMIAAKLGL